MGTNSELVAVMETLKAGDTVEISYLDGRNTVTTKRRVTMSWEDYKTDAAIGRFKCCVMLGPSAANKAHLNKPGGGGGALSDYGDEVMFQATLSTQVKRVLDLRKI